MVRTKKTHTINFKIDLKKQYTHETMLVNDKSIEIIDPDNLKEGETFIDKPPSRGYVEYWMQGITQYVVYPLTVTELKDHINNNTLQTITPLGMVNLDSEYCCVCNTRNKPNTGVDKNSYTVIDQWSGKVYTRIYDLLASTKKLTINLSFITFEGVKSGRGGKSFICWPAKYTNDFLSNLAS